MKRTNLLMYKFDIEKVKKLAEQKKKENLNVMVTKTFTDQVVESILTEIQKDLDVDTEVAWILVAGVLQRGGSNLKAGNAISYTIGDKTLSSHTLQKVVKKHSKNGTNRQLARTIADEIATLALALNIPGDLHAQMRYEHPNLTETDAIWCSNFQTTNPQCPENVRSWLVENYKSRFNR